MKYDLYYAHTQQEAEDGDGFKIIRAGMSKAEIEGLFGPGVKVWIEGLFDGKIVPVGSGPLWYWLEEVDGDLS
jgi:hypothetical protein